MRGGYLTDARCSGTRASRCDPARGSSSTIREQFTKKDSRSIPVITVVEEAQSVLGISAGQGEGPFVAWVKEGRKYDLGAVLITQQPGSIPQEILSQGDNWFVFHLLSEGDLRAVKKANAHFSDDLLSSLLNEPIPGHGVFWSSSGDNPVSHPDPGVAIRGRLPPARSPLR